MAPPGGHLLSNLLCSIIIIFWLCCCACGSSRVIADQPFDDNYVTNWGDQQFKFLDAERTQAQIEINQYSGGGGFRSKDAYGSGYFHMRLKVPKNTTAIITTFYLTSLKDNEPGGNHDELDFEFLGRIAGPDYVLQTNIFAQDDGRREQQLKLWFDPTSDFHKYAILWNQKQIVFFVDTIPVRVFRNNAQNGVNYPKLPMFVRGSLWNSSQWLGATDWSQGPFYACYREFGVEYACRDGTGDCWSLLRYYWNKWDKLSPVQEARYEFIKEKHLIYDYCNSAASSGNNNFPECLINGH